MSEANIQEALAEIQESLDKIKAAVDCGDEKQAVHWIKDILNPPTVAILLAVLGGPVVTQQLLGGQAIPTSFEEAGSLLDKHLVEPEVVVEEKKEEPVVEEKKEEPVVEEKKEEPPAAPVPE